MHEQSDQRARRFVEVFEAAWDDPDPERFIERFSSAFTDDTRLVQPLAPAVTGKHEFARHFGALKRLLPDLRGRVVHWAVRDDILFIEVVLSATAGRRHIEWHAIDRIRLDEHGRCAERISFFDSVPLIATLLASPRLAFRMWRAGIRPRLSAPTTT